MYQYAGSVLGLGYPSLGVASAPEMVAPREVQDDELRLRRNKAILFGERSSLIITKKGL